MGERLEYALHALEAIDPEILELRRLAHETHQDTAGLTSEQKVVLYAADEWIVGKSIISNFDRHQTEVLLSDHAFSLT